MPAKGVAGTVGTLSLAHSNPLRGARVKRLSMDGKGNAYCELLEDRPGMPRGTQVRVGPGEFKRSPPNP